jgi:hypothetical protein
LQFSKTREIDVRAQLDAVAAPTQVQPIGFARRNHLGIRSSS